ncbi:hypothetical protein HPB51_021207 [Rhipicephalus microplus]|uniref:M13 family peptidase n=1 Tax=Rhipicephalus microplus TaxID=6941 RepID=A0A9J6F611_RHIMP|nr:hypothetical protein HPB51_021207 [Rhipicephalus microplus]
MTIPTHSEQSEGSRKRRKKKKGCRRRKREDEKPAASVLPAQESTSTSRLSSSAVSSSTSVVAVSPRTADSTASAPGTEAISGKLACPWPKGIPNGVKVSLQQNSATDKAPHPEPSEPRPVVPKSREKLHSEPSLGGATPLGWTQGRSKSRSCSRIWGGSLFDLSPSTKIEETPLLIGSHSSMPELFGRWAASPSMEPHSSGVNDGIPAGAPRSTGQSFSAPDASISPPNAGRRGAGRQLYCDSSMCYLSPIRCPKKLPSATVAEPVVGINRVKAAVVVVGFGLFWLLFLVTLLFLWEHREITYHKDPLCRTEDCAKHANLLVDIISTSNVNPCDDFAAFVCSARSLPGFPSNGNHYESAMGTVINNWYSRLDEMLHVAFTMAPIARKPLRMYESCLEDSHLDSDAAEFLRFVNETELSWPAEPGKDVDALSVYVSHAFYYEAPAWFSIAIRETPKNRSSWRLIVSPSPYLPEMLERHESASRSGSYSAYCESLLRAIVGIDAERLGWDERVINETGVMEHDVLWKLYGATMAAGGPRESSALTPIERLDNYTPSVSGARWLTALQRSLPLQPMMATEVYLTDVAYMRAVGELFAKYDDRQLVRHLSWLFVQRYAPIVNVTVLVNRFDDVESANAARRSFCGWNVDESYGLLISVLYFVSRVFRPDKTSIDTAFDFLTLAASSLVAGSSWLDTQSKSMAVEKLRAVNMSIWPSKVLLNTQVLDTIYRDFPEKLHSITGYWTESRRKLREAVQRPFYRQFSNQPMNAAEPYLTYEATENRVLAAIGAVSRPLYYGNGTRGMLYGGIGFLMTLEIVKSLDTNGLRWHPNGSFVPSMLTDESTERFEARDSCFGKNESVFPEVPAVEVAYSALQEALARDRRRFRLAENLTEEMVFFLTLCLMTCRRKHTLSTASADCNKAVRNFAPFATAFSCPVGSSMNPREKCEFFV